MNIQDLTPFTATLFSSLSNTEIEIIFNYLKPIKINKNVVLLKQNSVSTGLFLIIKGHINITVKLFGDEEFFLGSLSDGQYFGEISILEGGIVSASVTTTQTTECYWLDVENITKLKLILPEVFFKLQTQVALFTCTRIRKIHRKIKGFNEFKNSKLQQKLVEEEDGYLIKLTKLPPSAAEIRKNIHFLRELDEDEYKLFKKNTELFFIPKDHIVYSKSSQNPSCYLVIEGAAQEIEIYKKSFSKLRLFAPGDVFGNLEFIDLKPRMAHVISREDMTVIKITHADLEKIKTVNLQLWQNYQTFIFKDLATFLRQLSKLLLRFQIRDEEIL